MGKLGFHCHDLDHIESNILGNGLHRGEFYSLYAEELPRLRELVETLKLQWSIHTPLVKLDWYPHPHTWSFLCDFSPEKRQLTRKMAAMAVEQAADLGAEYVVVHFPTPASMIQGEDESRLSELEDIARGSCEFLAELSLKRGVPIHIEGVGMSPLMNAPFLVRMLSEFDRLRYCFDTAHTYLAALNRNMDYYALAEEVRLYLGSVHLWNTRGMSDYHTFRHIPVHPSQDPKTGWIDIPRVLAALGAEREDIALVFESEAAYPVALGRFDYRDGIEWVRGLAGGPLQLPSNSTLG